MAEIMKLLESNGAFQCELMQSFLSSAQLPGTNLGSQTLPNVASDMNLNINTSTLSSTSTYGRQDITSITQNMNENEAHPRTMPIDNLNVNTASNLNEMKKFNLVSDISSITVNINKNATVNLNIGTKPDTTEDLNGNINSGSLKQKNTTAHINVEPTGARPITSVTNANNQVDVAEILAEVNEKPHDTRQKLIDEVTSAIVDAHMNTTINTYANVAAANERIQREINEMPDMSSLSINGPNLWQLFMGAMVPEITKVLNFCTKLPGFSEIEKEDKISLIKQGCFEVMVARFCVLIDHVKEEMLDPTLTVKATRSAVCEMPMGPFLSQFFTVASQFNPTGLTDAEIGTFTAVLMICPERNGLKNQSVIKVLHKLLLQALHIQLKQSHEDADKALTTLINMVPVFHKINDDHLKFIKMIKMKSPAEFEKKFPPLHKELFDTC